GPWYRWKIAALAGMTAAGLGLVMSQVITQFWQRPRPFVAHPHETILLVAPSAEPSFPSDHAVAAFAIAFAVAFVGRRMGAAFLAGATLIAVSRVIAGLHYPGDILGGAAIGLVSAAIVFSLGGAGSGRIVGGDRLFARRRLPRACRPSREPDHRSARHAGLACGRPGQGP